MTICGGLPNWFPTPGLGDKRTRYKITGTRASGGLCSGVSGAAGPEPPVPRRLRPPTSHRVFLKWGNHPRGPAEKRVAGGGGRAPRRAAESEPRVFQGTRGTGARSASGRAAEGRPGGGARAAGGKRGGPPGQARGVGGRAQAAAGAGSPGPSSFRTGSRAAGGRRPAVRLHGGAGPVHAPSAGKRPNRSAQEPAQRPGAAAPRGTWPGEGSPVRDRACAVARARPSAGKEHAQ